MKIQLKTKNIVIFSIIFSLTLVITAFGVYLYNSRSSSGSDKLSSTNCVTSETDFPYILSESTLKSVTQDEIWVGLFMQPVVEGFEEKDGKQYILTQIESITGECKQIKLLVGGDIQEADIYNSFDDYNRIYYNGEFVSYPYLKDSIKVGNQIRVEYLEKAPKQSLLNDEFCKQFGFSSEFYCTMQRVNENELGNTIQGLNLSDSKTPDGYEIFVNIIYSELLSEGAGNTQGE